MTIKDIEKLGIIGAGGAGFPTHVKLQSRPDTVIMNAAECEPLLHKDLEIISHLPNEVIRGMKTVMDITGARKGIIGIKEKHHETIKMLQALVPPEISIIPVEDIYPAGDEITLIYLTTQRVVQPGALPSSVGCLVLNVETLLNIGQEHPVVDKYISVAGAVEKPATIKVPVGTPMKDILASFKITADKYVIRSGGIMMGKVENDLNEVISKRTGALLVLPEDHHCVTTYRRFATDHDVTRIAKAACDQCNFCTELCPRYLLGQPVRPELAMRNRMFGKEEDPGIFPGNLFCCECNLCTMYACPEGLDPKGATLIEKRISRKNGAPRMNNPSSPHPMIDYRKVPTSKLMQRLDLRMFRDEGPLKKITWQPTEIRVPLKEHIGSPAEALVKTGQTVSRYELIGQLSGQISSHVHSPVNGVVTRVTAEEISIKVTQWQ